MVRVVKRDGEAIEFSLNEITEATRKALRATSKNYNNGILELLSLRVTVDFQNKMKDGEISVEEIQDNVKHVLEQAGYIDVVKACILYRKQRKKIRNMNSTILDYKDMVNSHVRVEDWRVEENSAVIYSAGGLILSDSGAVTANYWLSRVYDQEIAEARHNAGIHIHDPSMLAGYCAGRSLRRLLMEGLGGVTGKITSSPAKHLSVLCNQIVNFLGVMQNEWAGARAFSSFGTYLAPLVKADNLAYPEVKKCVKSFIYEVNTLSRWGTQTPLSNITLDWTIPNDMTEMNAIVGGRETDFKYKDCKKEMDMINRAFIETMTEGDADGRGFQYPIPMYSITNEFDWSDTENNRPLLEMTPKYRTPYFSSYINSDMRSNGVRSMYCCFRSDLRELRKKTGGFSGPGESTGSVDIVTVSMPRIIYQAKDEAGFYVKLDYMMDMSAHSLETKRQVIIKLSNQGPYPRARRYLGTPENHFSTIGLIGMDEAGLNTRWVGKGLIRRECQEFTKDTLSHTRERLSDYQELYDNPYSLETTPVKSTIHRSAGHDKQRYPDIITVGVEGDTPCYTNGSHLPIDYMEDVLDALDIQNKLQTLYALGAAFHAFLGEKILDWKTAANLVRTAIENYKLPYYMLSPTYSICECHGYLIGEYFTCLICGEKAEVYSRITGHCRPVQNWNESKTQEYKNHANYSIGRSQLKHDMSRIMVDARERASSAGIRASQRGKEKGVTSAYPYPFTIRICPNCVPAGEFLKGQDYQIVDMEERPDLTEKFDIVQVPTLVIVSGDIVQKFADASNTRRLVEQNHTSTVKA